MDKEDISEKISKLDGIDEYWWNGVNYHNVIPEEMIDTKLQSVSKYVEREEQIWEL